MKQKSVCYILCILFFFIGLGGLHRLYLGKTGTGILQLLTLGGFGIWQLIDLFLIPSMVDEVNQKNPFIQAPMVQSQAQTQTVIVNISKESLLEDSKQD